MPLYSGFDITRRNFLSWMATMFAFTCIQIFWHYHSILQDQCNIDLRCIYLSHICCCDRHWWLWTPWCQDTSRLLCYWKRCEPILDSWVSFECNDGQVGHAPVPIMHFQCVSKGIRSPAPIYILPIDCQECLLSAHENCHDVEESNTTLPSIEYW